MRTILLKRATVAIVSVALFQALVAIALRRTFPAVPSRGRSMLESCLIPLLPFSRRNGHFKVTVFRQKWLYWPLTRARRLLLRLSERLTIGVKEPTALYVNVTDGSFDRIPLSSLPPRSMDESNKPNSVRYVALSDTHLLHGDIVLPPGDVLIHCGDILVEDRGLHLGSSGRWRALLDDFNNWLGNYRDSFRYRLVTGGNHDQILQDLGTASSQKILSNGTYIDGGSIQLNFTNIGSAANNNGPSHHHVYVSAASRGYKTGGANQAFQYTSDEAAEEIWSKVPSNISILVTHGPPRGILDGSGSNAGCPVLRRHVQKNIQPKVHLFGHWHDAPGSVKVGETVYINAASVDFDYAASNSPVVFDLVY